MCDVDLMSDHSPSNETPEARTPRSKRELLHFDAFAASSADVGWSNKKYSIKTAHLERRWLVK
jgi:hypothetical protein